MGPERIPDTGMRRLHRKRGAEAIESRSLCQIVTHLRFSPVFRRITQPAPHYPNPLSPLTSRACHPGGSRVSPSDLLPEEYGNSLRRVSGQPVERVNAGDRGQVETDEGTDAAEYDRRSKKQRTLQDPLAEKADHTAKGRGQDEKKPEPEQPGSEDSDHEEPNASLKQSVAWWFRHRRLITRNVAE
jgi:hypothetical protein